jgi:NAD(P)H-flavin reductase
MSTAPRASYVAHVAGRRDVGGGMTLFALDVPSALRESYVRPGQYAHLTRVGEAGYFVLGSREKRSPWEIVLRRGGAVADVLLASPVGLDIAASKAIGSGFPVDDARGHHVVMLVTAGAIAAARAVVGRRIEDGDGPKTRLVIGARALHTIPFEDELEAIRAAGVAVRIVLSGEGPPDPRLDHGYVQHLLDRVWTPDAWVFVAGSDAMVRDVKSTAHNLGALPERVVSNI